MSSISSKTVLKLNFYTILQHHKHPLVIKFKNFIDFFFHEVTISVCTAFKFMIVTNK